MIFWFIHSCGLDLICYAALRFCRNNSSLFLATLFIDSVWFHLEKSIYHGDATQCIIVSIRRCSSKKDWITLVGRLSAYELSLFLHLPYVISILSYNVSYQNLHILPQASSTCFFCSLHFHKRHITFMLPWHFKRLNGIWKRRRE